MEPMVLATMAVTYLAPYLATAGEVLAKKAGEAAWEKMSDVYAAVKHKFAGDDYAQKTLERVAADPESETRQAALIGVLEEKLNDDPTFAESLQKLLDEAEEAGAGRQIVQQITVSGHGSVKGDLTQIGEVRGNIDLSKKK